MDEGLKRIEQPPRLPAALAPMLTDAPINEHVNFVEVLPVELQHEIMIVPHIPVEVEHVS